MRIFFCVELADTVRDALEEVARMVRAGLSAPAKWVAKDNFHITVRFLGEVEEAMLPEIKAVGAELARGQQPFEVTLSRLGAFPSVRRARVIWAGPEQDSPQFAELVRNAEMEARALGFSPERKEAKAHVTLARLKVPRDVAHALTRVPFPTLNVEVGSLTLMESRLRPEGPLYTPIERWPLGGEDGLRNP